MRIIFCLYLEIDLAKKAIDKLLEASFPEEEMNCIVQESMAKEYLKIQAHNISYLKGSDAEHEKIRGLRRLFGGQQAVNTTDAGRIYAAGTTATTMAGAASIMPNGGLIMIMKEFDLPEETAQKYIDGLIRGGILFWVRTEEKRTGEAISIMEHYLARKIFTISPGIPT